jgi:glutaredoxin-like protein NrdH
MTEVTVYTKPACVQCNATYRKLDKDGIAYNSVDISRDEAALDRMKSLGHLQAPVVTLHRSGELVDSWSGFRPDKLEALSA